MNAADFYGREPTGSQAYGATRPNGRVHTGDDFSHSTRPNTVTVPYVEAGIVTSIQHDHPNLPNGYGNQVQVTHGDSSRFTYSHLGRITAHIGQHVTPAGSPGTEGDSGTVTGNCVHIELWEHGARRDPYPRIRSSLAGTAGGETEPFPIEPQKDDMPRIYQISDGGYTGIVLALAPESKIVAADATQAQTWGALFGGLKPVTMAELPALFDAYAIPRNLIDPDMLASWTKAQDILKTVQ